MCNCKQNEFELLPELETRSTKLKTAPVIWRGLPDSLDTEFESSLVGKCELQPGGIQGGRRALVRDTSIEPFKYICKIEMDDGSHCTGTLIAPNKVITSAHCLYDRNTSTYSKGIRVVPGKNGDGSSKRTEPFGFSTAIRIDVPDDYKTALDYKSATPFDYGVITLKEPIGKRIGYWRRLAYKPDDLLLKHKVNTAGYAGDIDGNKQVSAYDQNVAVYPQTIEFKLDICGGQSGSPLWVRWRQFRAIVGIVKRVGGTDTKGNVAVRMSPSVLQNIQQWLKN